MRRFANVTTNRRRRFAPGASTTTLVGGTAQGRGFAPGASAATLAGGAVQGRGFAPGASAATLAGGSVYTGRQLRHMGKKRRFAARMATGFGGRGAIRHKNIGGRFGT